MNLLQQVCSVAVINFSSTGAQTLVTPVTGQQVRVYAIYFVVAGATNVTFADGSVTDGAMALAANQQFALAPKFTGEPWFQSAIGSGFQITTSSAVQTSGRVYYLQSAARA